jgi:hypothetical protein
VVEQSKKRTRRVAESGDPSSLHGDAHSAPESVQREEDIRSSALALFEDETIERGQRNDAGHQVGRVRRPESGGRPIPFRRTERLEYGEGPQIGTFHSPLRLRNPLLRSPSSH